VLGRGVFVFGEVLLFVGCLLGAPLGFWGFSLFLGFPLFLRAS
jgi:hypothetical protein